MKVCHCLWLTTVLPMLDAGHDPEEVLEDERFYNDIIKNGAKVGACLLKSLVPFGAKLHNVDGLHNLRARCYSLHHWHRPAELVLVLFFLINQHMWFSSRACHSFCSCHADRADADGGA